MENSFSSKISDLINSNRQNEYIYDIFLRGTVKYIESKIEETMICCYVNKSLKDEVGNIPTHVISDKIIYLLCINYDVFKGK